VSGRTAPILRGLGNERRLSVLSLVAQSQDGLTHAELLKPSGLARPTLSNTLGDLESLGLIARPVSNRGAWRCVNTAATRRFLAAAAPLAVDISIGALAEDRELADRFAGDPQPPDGRGYERRLAIANAGSY
jgi:DNA-binding transcriptional ArsR family regulator